MRLNPRSFNSISRTPVVEAVKPAVKIRLRRRGRVAESFSWRFGEGDAGSTWFMNLPLGIRGRLSPLRGADSCRRAGIFETVFSSIQASNFSGS